MPVSFFEQMQPAAAHSLRSHVCGLSGIFRQVHALPKNGLDFRCRFVLIFLMPGAWGASAAKFVKKDGALPKNVVDRAGKIRYDIRVSIGSIIRVFRSKII